MQWLKNALSEFIYGIPAGPDEAIEFAEVGDLTGLQQVVSWFGNKIWEVKDDAGRSVLQIAEANGHQRCVDYLTGLHQDLNEVRAENNGPSKKENEI